MRRIVSIATIAAVLSVAGVASASDSGGAGVPRTARQVLTGGGTAYAPRRAKPRAPRRVVRRAPAPKHHFPIAGLFGWGDSGSRFGAPRSGNTHQGQDLTAAEGTPVVSPFSGVVETVQYQASGAGHYVVLDGTGEDRDYVFMHLRPGSIGVRAGQRVPGGARMGEVGNSGRSFGAHLHLEIWVGGSWHSGGHPIDPQPLLRSWAR